MRKNVYIILVVCQEGQMVSTANSMKVKFHLEKKIFIYCYG